MTGGLTTLKSNKCRRRKIFWVEGGLIPPWKEKLTPPPLWKGNCTPLSDFWPCPPVITYIYWFVCYRFVSEHTRTNKNFSFRFCLRFRLGRWTLNRLLVKNVTWLLYQSIKFWHSKERNGTLRGVNWYFRRKRIKIVMQSAALERKGFLHSHSYLIPLTSFLI